MMLWVCGRVGEIIRVSLAYFLLVLFELCYIVRHHKFRNPKVINMYSEI